ncbi:MerR family transcriptional regulator [Actinoallomurus bryophytorum]|uniref:MerR family transcriptional regulator n=1 Tax=Actinoallomurus bryophytorum TaxID=1490222 RepID=UPI00115453CD|nr:MerR family transcriptional regulator [Actinoallomurus bryophytorum]
MSAIGRDAAGEELLRPREVADIFGVRTSTIAQWAREGRLTPLRTPGGHRRYTRTDVQNALVPTPPRDRSPKTPRAPTNRAGASGGSPSVSATATT